MKRLNYGKTFLLGFGFFGVSIIWALYNAYVPLILDDTFNMSASMVGFFMSLDNIAALLIQPSVGAWSDRLRTKIGRRLPFMLLGAPLAAIAFGLLPIASGKEILALFVACTITFVLSMVIWRTPVVALMPDVTPSRFRSQANGVINLMGGVGTIVAYLIAPKLEILNFKFASALPFWLGSASVIIAVLLVFIFIKEPKVPIENTNAEKPQLYKSLVKIFKEKQHSAIRLFLAIFFWFVAYNAIDAFLTLFATKHLGLEKGVAVSMLSQMSLLFLLVALPAGLLGSKIGRKKTISIGIVGMMLAMLSMFFIPQGILAQVQFKLPILGEVRTIGYILMFAGASWAFININSLPMVVDMTDPIHIGTYTGLYYFFSTAAAIIGPNLNGWIVDLAGENYAYIMFVGPVFMALALISILGVRGGEARKADNIL